MNVSCSAKVNACPLLLSAACVFYEGENLLYIGVNMNDSLQTALEKLNVAFSTLQGEITLTTIGSSGPSTFISDVLNVPNYTLSGLGGSLQAVTDIGSVTTNVITANGFTLPPQGIGLSTFKISQIMGENDYWNIYGYATVVDYGELVFELNDNAASINGQKFRFYYNNSFSGTSKDILLMTYDGATIDGTLQVNNLAGIGTRMVVADTAGLLSTQAFTTGTVTSVATSGPITGGPITSSGTIGITQSTISTDGYLSSIDWNTFNNKQNAIALTTTGSSGPSTFNGTSGALNIPDYSAAFSGFVPTSRQLTINGTAYDLSANRSWNVGTVTSITFSGPLTGGTITGSGTVGITQSSALLDGYLSSVDWSIFNGKQNQLNGTGFVKASGTTISYDNSTYVPTSRTLTINGTTYDLSADRSWTIPSANIYNSDGTLTGNRTVDLSTFTLNFSNRINLSTNPSGSNDVPLLEIGSTTAIGGRNQFGQLKLSRSASPSSSVTLNPYSADNLFIGGSVTNVVLGSVGVRIGGDADLGNSARLQVQGSGVSAVQFNATNVMRFLLVSTAASGRVWNLTSDNTGDFIVGQTYGAITNSFRIFGATNNIGINTGTDAGYKLDVNGTARVSGNTLVEKNQNAATVITIQNQNNNAASGAYINMFSSGSAYLQISKLSQLGTASGIISAGDSFIYNSNHFGDISIYNGLTTGKIKFAAGGTPTAQMTLTAAGRLLLGTTTESTFILDVVGTARVSDNFQVGTTANFITIINLRTSLANPLLTANYGIGNQMLLTFDVNGFLNMTGVVGFRAPSLYATTRVETALVQLSGNNRAVYWVNVTDQFIVGMSGQNYVVRANSGSLTSGGSLVSTSFVNGNTSFGGSTDVASAQVQIDSTTKGFLPPRMTTAQINAIATPAAGLIVYDNTTNVPNYYNGTAWVGLGTGTGTVTSIATTGPITGGTITTSGTIGITQSSASSDGYLSSTDWSLFNGKQPQLNGTGFVKASGTTISYDNSTYYLASNPSGFVSSNIYTNDGTLAGNRTVTTNGNSITFTGGGSFSTNVGIGGTPNAINSLQVGVSNQWSGAFIGNMGGNRTPSHTYGIHLGWNYTGGSGESNILWGTVPGASTPYPYLVFSTWDGTTKTDRVEFQDNGRVVFKNYQSTSSFTGTPVGHLAFDLSGNILTVPVPTSGTGTVTSIATSGPITGGTITTTGTIGITQATTSTDGYLSSTDWNTFNNKLNNNIYTADGVLTANRTVGTATGFKLTLNPNLEVITTTYNVIPTILGWSAVNGYVQTTIPASTSFSATGYAFSALIGNNYMTYQGSATFAANTLTGAIVGINNIRFTAASSTITITQSSSIRTYSAGLFQNTTSGSVNGTITHMSGLAVRPIFQASGTSVITVTNNYGLLIADQNEFSHATITNRWGIYQEGISDNNYFSSKLLVGTTTDIASAKVIIDSTSQGVLVPRMTTTQINAITSPADGLLVYNTTISHMCCYLGGTWHKFNSSNM